MSDSIKQIFYSTSHLRWKAFLWLVRITMIFIGIALMAQAIDHYVVPHFLHKNESFRMVIDPDETWSIPNRYNKRFTGERKALLTAPSFACQNCRHNSAASISFPASIKAIELDDSFDNKDLVPNNVNLIIEGKVIIREGVVQRNSPERGMLADTVMTVPVLHQIDDKVDAEKIIVQLVKQHVRSLAVDFTKDNRALWVLENYTMFKRAGISVISIVRDFRSIENQLNLISRSELIFVKPDIFQLSRHSVDAGLAKMLEALPSNKVVLQISAGGISRGSDSANELTYLKAVSVAEKCGIKVLPGLDSYCLRFSAPDSLRRVHQVAFMDAVSVFRLLKLAEDLALRGVSVTDLRGEDKRVWEIMKHNAREITISLGKEGTGLLRVIPEPAELSPLLPPGRALKKLVLTFDDGPEEEYTNQILDILEREEVPAVFFVTGLKVEKNIPLLKKIIDEGHEVGNHTFTHPNLLHVSDQRKKAEIFATTGLIECITGRSTRIYRAPNNADEFSHNDEILPVSLGSANYLRIGDGVNPKDLEKGTCADTIISRVFNQLEKGGIILLHDGGGDRAETVKALPAIIRMAKDSGYVFTSLADYSGLPEEEIMPALHDDNDLYLSFGNSLMAGSFYGLQRMVYVLFFMALILGTDRLLFLAVLAAKQKLRKFPVLNNQEHCPFVSVVVPAYNEESTAVKTIQKLLELDYPNYEIILVDDGSSDKTYSVVQDNFRDNPTVRVYTKDNEGKASAINYGVDQSGGKIILAVDAGTILRPDALRKIITHFSSPEVAVVSANVKVGNSTSWWSSFQSLENITSVNLELRAFNESNCISMLPQAIAAYRKDLLIGAGKFKSGTLAEDCDLAMRILRQGFRIRFAEDAVAYAHYPPTVAGFMKQKFRRTFGVLQCWWKHRNTLFNPKFKGMGMVGMPYLLVFNYFFPLLIPIVDLVMVFSLLQGEPRQIPKYYLSFLGLELLLGAVSLKMDKEPLYKLVWFVPQRLFYRGVLWLVLTRTLVTAINMELMSWGFLKRPANVQVPGKTKLS